MKPPNINKRPSGYWVTVRGNIVTPVMGILQARRVKRALQRVADTCGIDLNVEMWGGHTYAGPR